MSKEQTRDIIDRCLTEMYHMSEPIVEFKDVKDAFAYGDIDSLVKRSIIQEKDYLIIANKYRKQLSHEFFKLFVHTVLMYRPRIQKEDGDIY
jgi:hypothetical protein